MTSHEMFTSNGMLCRAISPRTAPCLIFVHAFACNGTNFLPIFHTRLAEKFRLVAVDLPGFGGSPGQPKCSSTSSHANALVELAKEVCGPSKMGFVAHSLGSVVAVEAIRALNDRPFGLFSIEGNLTADDAYFSGMAADFTDAIAFKKFFLEHLWNLGISKPIYRSYYANASMADPEAMWQLGCDARRVSVDDMPGIRYRSISAPSLYYWNVENVPPRTLDWIGKTGIVNLQFDGASHWPMIDIPLETAHAIGKFFKNVV